ncbi:MAG: hypothetical protein ACTSWF_10400 [Candidatus Freyarchaeota archaeon]
MSERTTGVLVGGIIALIGALLGLAAPFVLLAPAAFDITQLFAPTVIYGYIVLILGIIALILSILMIAGKWIKWSTVIVLIIGIISLIGFMGGALGVLPGIIEIIGAIIALAFGALE